MKSTVKKICFTGHRKINCIENLTIIIEEKLSALIENGASEFYAGGALGWDMLCEQTVLRLRENFPHIKLHLILPCFPEFQTKMWEDTEKAAYYKILKSADSVEYLSAEYTKDCMQKRNARLVELADCCVCYYNNSRNLSGTAQTLRIARKKGIEIINLFVSENDS